MNSLKICKCVVTEIFFSQDGNKAHVNWKVTGLGHMEGGGPYLWRKSLINSCSFDHQGVKSVKNELDPNGNLTELQLRAKFSDVCLNPSHQNIDVDKPTWECDDMCVRENGFIKDQMLSLDMGLYYDFTTNSNTSRVSGYTEDGSVSCPGKLYMCIACCCTV